MIDVQVGSGKNRTQRKRLKMLIRDYTRTEHRRLVDDAATHKRLCDKQAEEIRVLKEIRTILASP